MIPRVPLRGALHAHPAVLEGILVHHHWISAQTDNKLGTDIKDNSPCHSNEGGLETLPAVRSARVTVSN
jgi:hypothetical protein